MRSVHPHDPTRLPTIPAMQSAKPEGISREFMLKAFVIFAFLQVADLATTVTVFRLGGVEQNPLVQRLMVFGPVTGIVLAKLVALAIGGACVMTGKVRALYLANLVFFCIVAWNLTVIQKLVWH